MFIGKINCGSLNIRGMRNVLKRKKLYKYIREQKLDIICLQETHSDHKSNHIWQNEWGSKSVFSNGESNARGVATLLSGKLSKSVKEVVRDMEGRYLILKCELNNYSVCVANIYAPNNDDPKFFDEVFNEIKAMDCVQVMVCGDFNVAMNSDLDHNCRSNTTKPRSIEIIKSYMEEDDMIDIWRHLHQTKKSFTWVKCNPRMTWSRLDYCLLSSSMMGMSPSCEIIPCTITDHSMVLTTLEISEQKRGPGIWRFNNQLLGDQVFCDQIRNIIKGTLRSHDYMNAIELWELLKYEISEFTKKYTKAKNLEKGPTTLTCTSCWHKCRKNLWKMIKIKNLLQISAKYRLRSTAIWKLAPRRLHSDVEPNGIAAGKGRVDIIST